MRSVSIDPGIRGCGVALWDLQRLTRAAYVKNPELSGNHARACVQMALAIRLWIGEPHILDTVIVEWPEMYSAAHQKGDQNDLPPLAGVDMALAGIYWAAQQADYLPKQWKGQLPKGAAFNQRVMARLNESEVASIVWPATSLQHNVWDAIGIGLHHYGRFARHRVFSAGGNFGGDFS